MITANNLCKEFDGRKAVQSLSFHLEKGEVFGFLGPNGAGKTTTMRMLTCYFPPSDGNATVAGFDIQKDSIQVRRNIGYLPENVPLYPDMTALESVDFAASAKGVPGRDRNKWVDEALSRCNLTKVQDQLVGTLSRGFRQRVGLAQAIVNKPKVLILDEPTVGLDPAQIRDIRELIKSLAENSTVILSTHILPEVEAMCGRVMILANGKMQAIDTLANLKASLSGTSVVNLTLNGANLEELRTALSPIEGLRNIEPTLPGSFSIQVETGQEIRPELSRIIVNKGWDLLSISQGGMSTEDIFLQVVRDSNKPEQTNAAEPAQLEETK